MKIIKLALQNFRQFYGNHEIVFSTDKDKNVTLIHAENTYGKTTLLNAILWCFYEDTTSKFENKSQIINWEAEKEHIKTCSVSVWIEHENAEYLLERTFKTNQKITEFEAFKIECGNHHPLPSPANFIRSVVPQEMAKYYFFDGEAAENFSSERNTKAVGNAIRAMLGCSLAEQAVLDLNKVSNKLSKNISSCSKSKSVLELQENIDASENLLREYEEDLQKYEMLAEQYQRDIDKFSEELKNYQFSKKYQELREQNIKDKKIIEERIVKFRDILIRWIASEGLSLISRRGADKVVSILDQADVQGKIPSPYNEDFVKKLISEKICICGTSLDEGSIQWKSVLSLLETAGKKEIQSKMIKLRSFSDGLISQSKKAESALEKVREQLEHDKNSLSLIEQSLKEISEKLKNYDENLVSNIESSRKDCVNKYDRIKEKIGTTKFKRKKLIENFDNLKLELKKKAAEDVKIRYISNRKSLIDDAVELLKATLDKYQEEARKNVESSVNNILKIVSHNHRMCRFNENFSLELIRSDGTPCPKSSGESQLLSLIFMASLVKFSASRQNIKNIILKPGASAPLVLDSPFGQLDELYQKETATYIPKFAEQVVLFLSSTQGNSEVLSALSDRIGAEYALVSQSNEGQGDKTPTSLKRYGTEFVTKLYDQDKDTTSILKII